MLYIVDAVVQDLPNQSAQAMRDGSDCFVIAHPGGQTPEDDLHLGTLLPDCSMGELVKEAAHRAVAFGGTIAAGFSCALLPSRTNSNPGSKLGGRGECRGFWPDFRDNLLSGVHPQPRQLGQSDDRYVMRFHRVSDHFFQLCDLRFDQI